MLIKNIELQMQFSLAFETFKEFFMSKTTIKDLSKTTVNTNERILAYKLSKIISEDDINNISGGADRQVSTNQPIYKDSINKEGKVYDQFIIGVIPEYI